ncbi:hypothetical protein GCM10027290_54700 [Micromonospora sonneratiae]|uniref:Hsp70 family protein n=1 Tax=Micromonospora sonneratiae TaxID=1184706 RepID=UPI00367214E2
MSYGLGVDLGTTFTAAAVSGPEETAMVALGPNFVVPSVVHVAVDGTVTSGLAAEVAGARDPLRLCYWHKRRLGDPTPLVIGGAPYPPAALLAAQLRDVVATATRDKAAPPDSVVLTCPAVWGPYRRELFGEVPRLAGLTGVHVVTEPEAAAMHYSAERRLGTGETVAVYDLGGGTFDATILRVSRGGMEILGTPEGVEQLGGIDFDDALLAYADTQLDGAVSALDPDDSEHAALLAGIRMACVRAKEDLSVEPEVWLRISLPDGRREVRVTRAEFNDMIRPSVALTIEALRRTAASAGLQSADLSAVLLAGGSSRIPLIPQMVSDALGRPVRVSLHPKHIVALGAATAARRAVPKESTKRRSTSAASTATGVGTDVAAAQEASVSESPVIPPEPLADPAPQQAARSQPTARALHGLRRVGDRLRGTPRWLRLTVACMVLASVAVWAVTLLPQRGPAGATAEGTPTQTAGSVLPGAGTVPSESGVPTGGPGKVPGLKNMVVFDGTVGAPYQAYVSSQSDGWAPTMLGPDLSASSRTVTAAAEQGGTHLRVRWSGTAPAQFYIQSSVGRDMRAYADASTALVFDVAVRAAPTGSATIAMHCQYPCAGELALGAVLRSLSTDAQTTLRIPLRCFVERGLDLRRVDTVFLVGAGGALDVSFSNIRWVVGAADAPGALSCDSLS